MYYIYYRLKFYYVVNIKVIIKYIVVKEKVRN